MKLLERFTRTYGPYEVYSKVISEALRDKQDQELGSREDKPSCIALVDFQHDSYLATKKLLENLGGVLIADPVFSQVRPHAFVVIQKNVQRIIWVTAHVGARHAMTQ
ncbi:MAG: hypothetical protein ACUVWA_11770 [Candidatus Oleimicrobiaceae bacterium]